MLNILSYPNGLVTVVFRCMNASAPLCFHRQLSLNDLDQVLVIRSFVRFFKEENLLVCPVKKNFAEQVFMGTHAIARSVKKVDVSPKRTKREENKGVLEPAI